jgi:hypothetical protein
VNRSPSTAKSNEQAKPIAVPFLSASGSFLKNVLDDMFEKNPED